MRVSLGAGVALLVLLALVFVPRGLQYEGVQPPSIDLAASAGDPHIVTVNRVSRLYPLSDYRADLTAQNLTTNLYSNASIPQIVQPYRWSWEGRNVTFEDRDADGILSRSDAFTIPALPGPWRYRFQVYYIPRDATAEPPCPCAAGFVPFE